MDNFVLMASDTATKYRFVIKSACLWVRKVQPTEAVRDGHNFVLSEVPIRYDFKQTILKTIHLHKGLTNASYEFYEPQLPISCLVGLVSETANLGSLPQSPFNFKHFDLSYLSFFHEGTSYPNEAYTPNVEANSCQREYVDLMQFINSGMHSDRHSGITYDLFKKNAFLLPVIFSPGEDAVGVYTEGKQGHFRCEIRFRKPLPTDVAVLFFLTVESHISIDKDRDITFQTPL